MISTDQMGNNIDIKEYPKRIISLVPSITELLFDLGLQKEIVGVTSYCILPEKEVSSLPKVGGTKEFNFELIDKLSPDLIIAGKEENSKEGIEKLNKKYPVWVSDVGAVDDAVDMILSLGKLTGKEKESMILTGEITGGLNGLNPSRKYKAAYLIWKEPYMTVGGDTFINDMMKRSGFINIFSGSKRYPQIELDALEEAELILLSTEPYPFSPEDVDFFKQKFPSAIIQLVDGQIYSWYGSRMKYAAKYISELFISY